MPILWQLVFVGGYASLFALALISGPSPKRVRGWAAAIEADPDAEAIRARSKRDLVRYVVAVLLVGVVASVAFTFVLHAVQRELWNRAAPGERVLIAPTLAWAFAGVPLGLMAAIPGGTLLTHLTLNRERYRAMRVRDLDESKGRLPVWLGALLAPLLVAISAEALFLLTDNYLRVGASSVTHSAFFSLADDRVEASGVRRAWLVVPYEELDSKVDGHYPHVVLETESRGDYYISMLADMQERELHEAIAAFADRHAIPYRRVYRWPLEKGREKGGGG